MNRTRIFRTLLRGRFAALTALVGLGILLAASGAKAGGCGISYNAGVAPTLPAANHQGGELAKQDGYGENEPATIVGLWHLVYTATSVPIPAGEPPYSLKPPFMLFESYKTWHADGTEFENAFLPPGGGNICFGVWKDLGEGRVQLHHIGLMFGADGSVANIFTVDEVDAVAPDGLTYTGTFDFKLFGATDVLATGMPLAEIKGTTAGTRIRIPKLPD